MGKGELDAGFGYYVTLGGKGDKIIAQNDLTNFLDRRQFTLIYPSP